MATDENDYQLDRIQRDTNPNLFLNTSLGNLNLWVDIGRPLKHWSFKSQENFALYQRSVCTVHTVFSKTFTVNSDYFSNNSSRLVFVMEVASVYCLAQNQCVSVRCF